MGDAEKYRPFAFMFSLKHKVSNMIFPFLVNRDDAPKADSSQRDVH